MLGIVWASNASKGKTLAVDNNPFDKPLQPIPLNPDSDETDLPFPFEDDDGNPFTNTRPSKLYMEDPSNIDTEVEYNPETGDYEFKQKLGDRYYRPPTVMDFDEYVKYDLAKSKQDFFAEKKKEDEEGGKGFRPELQVNSEAFDRIFGGNTVDIRPNGSAELIFGVNVSRTDNPAIPEKQRRISTFDFDQKIQLNVIGNIGDKLKLTTNYNTEATFDFENQMKLEYTGYEDEIIQKIEAGNVTLPLSGSLITGSQSLFGLKTQLRFGRLTVTSVLSQQRGKKQDIEIQGGAEVTEYEIKADRYEADKHFFLSHYFRDQYETAVGSPPLINSLVNITRVEVWVTNTTTAFENTRNVIGFQDLGGGNPDRYYNPNYVQDNDPDSEFADNNANNLYNKITSLNGLRAFTNATTILGGQGLTAQLDYQKIESARKLSESEFTFHPQLGYISLNQDLNQNQALAVAYQYTYRGETYQVGEFSTDGITGQNALYLQMLQSTLTNTRIPMWDLMMKNVYAIGAYQVKPEGFLLNVWYLDQKTGVDINFIPEGVINGKPLLQVLGMDKVTVQSQAGADGVFDFLANPEITIKPNNGRVFIPLLEPFGQGLRDAIGNKTIADKYAFDSLYTNTQANAQVEFPNKNRFSLKGQYESSISSDISLGALNVPEGSVVVTAGGAQLQENIDYTVDYTLGRVKIINQGILESGTPIKISLESNSLFNIQSKTLMASRFDYKVSDNFLLGGTIMNLTERPLTQKVNYGDEPISNTIMGVDGSYKTDSRFLTKMVDKIPLIDTKEKSSVQVSGEIAKLFPGHSKAVGKDGTSYLDDFEGSQTAIDIRQFSTWVLASTPQGQTDGMFPEGDLSNDLGFNFNRAKFGWYVVDPLFYRNNNLTPDHIRNDQALQSNHYMREVFEQEVFPLRSVQQGQPNNIAVFDLAFYPSERGPYNYDVDGFTEDGEKVGFGLNANGTLKNPEERWGGIMRRIETNDFNAANVEFIQFWVMDPFNEDSENTTGGQLYFNIGNISEDILRDGLKSFENGLPTTEAESEDLSSDTLTVWGRVPTEQAIVIAFDNDPETRPFQDVGLDGLRDEEELRFFEDEYIDKIANTLGTSSQAYINAIEDPSADNFNYFRDDDYDDSLLNVVERYKKYNGLEGNSPTAEQSANLNADGYPTSASTLPNAEDINRDNTLDEFESYFQYEVDVTPGAINPSNIGNNYITDRVTANVSTPAGNRSVDWYQFKIPIRSPDKVVGGIADFRSIRFIRMFMRGFSEPIQMRFARLELIRGDWRKYDGFLEDAGEIIGDESNCTFNISAVNLEENASRSPVNYVLPPEIIREVNFGTVGLQQLNEQSLSYQVCGLADGTAKAAYKNIGMDVRNYKRLKMFVHAEAAGEQPLNDGDLRLFVRMGTDFENNYYEYEIPLSVTPEGNYNGDLEADQRIVWPDANALDVEFAVLQALKRDRNRALIEGTGNASLQQRYAGTDGDNAIYVIGNPNLSELKTIMIGVRNPRKTPERPEDDGLDKCAEIWVNELRLSDFDNQGGYAAIGRVTTKLADFANVTLAGSISTPGFGSVDQKVSERQQETIKQVDASANVELGKFLGDKSGIKVPMYVGFSQNTVEPKFDPANEDLELDPENIKDPITDSIRDVSKSLTIRRSLNFTNVRKERTNSEAKPHIYDVENLTFTYAYSEQFFRSYEIKNESSRTYRGGLGYNFSPQPTNFQPFKKTKLFAKSKYFRLVKDFNFYLTPKQLSFRTDMNRMYTEREARNNNPGFVADIPIFYNKTFTWDRLYDFKYDITKALKFDFNATNNAIVGEPQGVVDKEMFPDSFQVWKDSVRNSIQEFGTTTHYHHSANLNYNLPLNKFPLTDWVNASARYSADYDWQRAPFAADSLGHTIQNSNSGQINTTLNMLSLYNKVGYFKTVNRKFSKQRRENARKKGRDKKKKEDDKKEGEDEEEDDKKKKDKKDRITVVDRFFKGLMSIKNVSATFSENRGTLLPGYGRTTQVLGMDPNFNAPGTGFIFGQQGETFGPNNDLDIARYAANQGWLVQEQNLNTQYTSTYSKNMNFRASVEPINDMRVELTATQASSINRSEFFRFDEDIDDWDRFSTIETGNFTTSFLTFNTAFVGDDKDNDYFNQTFQNFLDNRETISQRLQAKNPNSTGAHQEDEGYTEGYGSTSQDVLIPAFLAAYSGSSPNDVGTNAFVKIPKPNWRITYNGLSKIPALKKYFKTVTLGHSYRSTYSVASYTTNLNYDDPDGDGFSEALDINGNYIPQYQIATVTIIEQFGPLLNVDMTWNNSLQTRVELKRDRNLSLSFANTQLTEIKSNELVVGAGYIFNDVELPFKLKATGKKIKSDLNVRADVSIRNNNTVIRKIVEEVTQATAGTNIITIKLTADYVISERLNIRLFFDRIVTKPVISTSFPTANTNAGVSVRFTLAS